MREIVFDGFLILTQIKENVLWGENRKNGENWKVRSDEKRKLQGKKGGRPVTASFRYFYFFGGV